MRFDVLTLFPAMFAGYLGQSLLKQGDRARTGRGRACTTSATGRRTSIRRWTIAPSAAAPAWCCRVEPVVECVEAVQALAPSRAIWSCSRRRGDRSISGSSRSWRPSPRLLLLCGRYEGFDERVFDILQPDEISIGDYVLNGGEVAAMVIIDAVIRLVPGVLGDEESSQQRFVLRSERDCSKCAQYTRPREYRGHDGARGAAERQPRGDRPLAAPNRVTSATRQRRADLLATAGSGSRDHPLHQQAVTKRYKGRIKP